MRAPHACGVFTSAIDVYIAYIYTTQSARDLHARARYYKLLCTLHSRHVSGTQHAQQTLDGGICTERVPQCDTPNTTIYNAHARTYIFM